MKKNNNKKTFWFLGIFIFSALAIVAVLSFLAFYDKTNLNENSVTVSINNSTDKNEDDFYLLTDQWAPDFGTIVAIDKNSYWVKNWGDTTSKQYLKDTETTIVAPSEVIFYKDGNQLIYTFLNREEYDKCTEEWEDKEHGFICRQTRTFISYDLTSKQRKNLTSMTFEDPDEYAETSNMQIINGYLYVPQYHLPVFNPTTKETYKAYRTYYKINLKDYPSTDGMGEPLERAFSEYFIRNDYKFGENDQLRIHENKIYIEHLEKDDNGNLFIMGLSAYDEKNNSAQDLWWPAGEWNYLLRKGFFYKNEYITTSITENNTMQIYGIDLINGKLRLIAEKEKFSDSSPINEKVFFEDEKQIYFYDLEKENWYNIKNTTTDTTINIPLDDSEKDMILILKLHGLDYEDKDTINLFNLYKYHKNDVTYSTDEDLLQFLFNLK